MMPFFSVIIPLYNKEKHIAETLKSVLGQSFQDFEVLVINDGSTDKSADEALSVKDDRIILHTIENQGVSHARNYGVSMANSNLMAFLDADDLWKPNHLENLKHLHEQFPDCGLYATAYEFQFNAKKISSVYHGIPKTKWSGIIDDFFNSSIVNCIAYTSAVMIPKKIYEDIGGFNPIYNSGEDIDLWIRMALNYKVAFTNDVSVIIHMTAQNKVSQTSINSRTHLDFDQFKHEEKTNQSLKKYLDLNRFSMAIQHKLAGNHQISKEIVHKIDNQNLNAKQRLLLKMDAKTLKKLIKLKDLLRKNGFSLSAFR